MRDRAIGEVAARHGLSEAAVRTLWEALRRGGGAMAQFSHPDLGGMGQWSAGGMVQIGDMFNDGLKARVAAACRDLAEILRAEPPAAMPDPPEGGGGAWWPHGLGHPSASGSQNGQLYAVFAQARRLAVAQDGRVTLYDTGRHAIFGVSQQQSRGRNLVFTADDGAVDLATLPVVPARRDPAGGSGG